MTIYVDLRAVFEQQLALTSEGAMAYASHPESWRPNWHREIETHHSGGTREPQTHLDVS